MNSKEVRNQFIWMLVSGFIATLVAILFCRRFESWWAGLIVGVPIALLLCDMKKSLQAITFACSTLQSVLKNLWNQPSTRKKRPIDWIEIGEASKETLMKALLVIVAISGMVVASSLLVYPGPFSGDNLIVLCVSAIVLCVSAVVGSLTSEVLSSINESNKSCRFKLLLSGLIYQKWNTRRTFTDDTEETPRLYSSAGFSWKGLLDVLLSLAYAFLLPSLLSLTGLCLTLLILIDLAFSILMFVACSQSIGMVLGATIGFTADWRWSPKHTDMSTDMIWMCIWSMVGAVSGWGLWKIRELIETKTSAFGQKSVET